MKRDKRWLLFITAIIGIIGCADALKATSLILGRSRTANTSTATTLATTTTTTSTTTIASDAAETVKPVGNGGHNRAASDYDEETGEEVVTKPPLTGIPQIDYVWDPNLPRELNGFNLSTYPFLNGVPVEEDIEFRCDGLHDGFYASIKFGCQLYHHCVYGIRHDFLCANFTAFDQKSFICHFVSEVNCKASAKYWFRNDALYKATTTTSTTTMPPPTTTTTTTQAPPERPRRPAGGRRPLRRRRPQHDYATYYDDDDDYPLDYYGDAEYADDPPNRRRKPMRQRPRRPESDYEYDNPRKHKDMEDDAYPHRPMHRDRTRVRDDDVDDYDYDRRTYDRPRTRNRPSADSRRYMDEDRRSFGDEEERRPMVESKRKQNERRPLTRRPVNSEDRKSTADDRRGSVDEPRRRRPFASDTRPLRDEEDEEVDPPPPPPSRKHSNAAHRDEAEYDEPRPAKRPAATEPKTGIVPKVRSSSPVASIFSRPRAPPKIGRPVPKNEKKKYEYQPQEIKTQEEPQKPEVAADEEPLYDDEYDYEAEASKAPPPAKQEKSEIKKSPLFSSQRQSRFPPRENQSVSKPNPIEDEYLDERVTSSKPQRSTSHRTEVIAPTPVTTPAQTHKPEIVDTRPVVTVAKSEEKPSADSVPEEFDDDFIEYEDEEIDPKNDAPKPIEEEQPPVVANDQRSVYRSPVKEPELPPKPISIESSRSHNTQDANVLPAFRSQLHRFTSPPSPSSTRLESEDGRFFVKPNVRHESNDRDTFNLYGKETLSNVPQQPSGFKPIGQEREDDASKMSRPYVRIMKRPFLPSRGGSPYLPRGLKPVGVGITNPDYSTSARKITSATESPSVSGAHLLGLHNSEPISRVNFNSNYPSAPAQAAPVVSRTTQPPQIEAPRNPLDDIYNSDYDVTINDALNPTLKPITQSHESSSAYDLSKYHNRFNPYARVDVSQSSSQYRAQAVRAPLQEPPLARHETAPLHSRAAPQQFTYDDYEY